VESDNKHLNQGLDVYICGRVSPEYDFKQGKEMWIKDHFCGRLVNRIIY
jgi:hypothetical protein